VRAKIERKGDWGSNHRTQSPQVQQLVLITPTFPATTKGNLNIATRHLTGISYQWAHMFQPKTTLKWKKST